MAALRYILLAAAITLTLALLAHLVLPARGHIPRRTGRRGGLGIAALTAVYAVAAFFGLGSARDPQQFCSFEAGESAVLALFAGGIACHDAESPRPGVGLDERPDVSYTDDSEGFVCRFPGLYS